MFDTLYLHQTFLNNWKKNFVYLCVYVIVKDFLYMCVYVCVYVYVCVHSRDSNFYPIDTIFSAQLVKFEDGLGGSYNDPLIRGT